MGSDSDLLYQRPGSPNWYTEFSVDGHRIRQSLRTSDKNIAKKRAAKIQRDALLDGIIPKRRELTLGETVLRDWNEHGQYWRDSANYKSKLRVFVLGRTRKQQDSNGNPVVLKVQGFGKETLLSNITDAVVRQYVARHRTLVANATINADLRILKYILATADKDWKVRVSEIEWPKHFLRERVRQRILAPQEERDFFRELYSDARAPVLFDLLTGFRIANVTTLEWDNVKEGHDDPNDDEIVVRMKGDEVLHFPITPEVRLVLDAQRGLHPKYVFTFVARRSRAPRRLKGQRYPFNKRWLWQICNSALKKIGLWKKGSPDNFRFHDLRHTAASQLLKATGNLKLVQEYLGHKNIKSTARYAHVLTDGVRQGMMIRDRKNKDRHNLATAPSKARKSPRKNNEIAA
jgi:integrase